MVTRRDTRCGEKQAPRTSTLRCGGSLSSLLTIRCFEERERAKLAREIAENLQAELDIREWAIGLKIHCDFGFGRPAPLLVFEDSKFVGSNSGTDIDQKSSETRFRTEGNLQAIGAGLEIRIGSIYYAPGVPKRDGNARTCSRYAGTFDSLVPERPGTR